MKISAKLDYACLAILELALHWPDSEPLQIERIAENQKIPIKFLIQILLQLKELGMVDSLRGKKGGYYLLKSPKEIKLSDLAKPFLNWGNYGKANSNPVFSAIWQNLDAQVMTAMESITFDEILRREKDINKAGLYAI